MQTPLRLFPDDSETIEGVGAAIRAGKTTCAAVLEHCFHQIDLWDERVHAWTRTRRTSAVPTWTVTYPAATLTST